MTVVARQHKRGTVAAVDAGRVKAFEYDYPSLAPLARMSVYFIRQGTDGPIKIGLATSVRQRLKDLQCANPYRLNVLARLRGNRAVEHRLHQVFAPARLHGEWFQADPLLLSLIETIRAKPWWTQ